MIKYSQATSLLTNKANLMNKVKNQLSLLNKIVKYSIQSNKALYLKSLKFRFEYSNTP